MKKKFGVLVCVAVLCVAVGAVLGAGLFAKTADVAYAAEDVGARFTHTHSIPFNGNLSADGEYYLDDDFSSTITVEADVTLCLNGHNIDGGMDGTVIEIKSGAKLTLCDCQGGGSITGGTDGGVKVVGGEFVMKSGAITDNQGRDGAGVFTDHGTFTMEGGTISGNSATMSGGGVHIHGGTFTMSGGLIENNSAGDFGGGVYFNGGRSLPGEFGAPGTPGYSSTFIMTGGMICDNTAGDNGGGVQMDSLNTMFKISGDPIITGNKVGGSDNNVSLYNAKITVTDILDGAEIGITLNEGYSGAFTTGYGEKNTVGGSVTAPETFFISDNDGFEVVPDENGEEVMLTAIAQSAATVAIGDGEPVGFDTIEEAWEYANANAAADDTAYITLLSNVTITGSLNVNSGVNIHLDLDGHILRLMLQSGSAGRAVITVGGQFTLTDGNSQELSHRYYIDDGLWVFVDDDDEDDGSHKLQPFTGGVITGGTGHPNSYNYRNYGGGVFVGQNGTFVMSGGSISGNSSEFGGGVGVFTGGTFIIESGKICGNKADSVGGVIVKGGSFTMKGGEISYNTADYTGGVSVEYDNEVNNNLTTTAGEFIMEGGSISHNTALRDSGGVAVSDSSFTMKGGEISHNNALRDGGGVSVNRYATFTMENGSINNNTAATKAGGVMIGSNGTFNMENGSIKNNNAGENGSGVFFSNVNPGTFSVSGSPVISDNSRSTDGSADNVYLDPGYSNTITFSGELQTGAEIHVFRKTGGYVATGYTQDERASLFFFPDDPSYPCIYTDDDGTVWSGMHWWDEGTVTTPATCTGDGVKTFNCQGTGCIATKTEAIPATNHTPAPTLSHDEYSHWYNCTNENCDERLNEANHSFVNGVCTCGETAYFEVREKDGITSNYKTIAEAFGNVSVNATIKMFADATTPTTLSVGDGKTVTLDLNGCMLKYNGVTTYGHLITVIGNFTLIDSNPDSTHYYTVDETTGLWVFGDSGTEFKGGVITGMNSRGDGGGVGVNQSGTFVMESGAICGNLGNRGGGVYVDCNNDHTQYGTFEMKGGSICGNVATMASGGVLFWVTDSFKISGHPVITDNKRADGTDDNVYVSDNKFTVAGALEDGAKIGIRLWCQGAVATGFTQNGNPADFFIPDNGSYACVYVSKNTDGIVSFMDSHNAVTDEAVDATCCDSGLTEGSHCSACGTVIVQQETVAPVPTAHEWGDWEVAKAPTCDEGGSKTRKCVHDNSHTETEPITATGHEWGDWEVTKAPTCDKDGSRTCKCANDESHTDTEAIPAIGHEWGDWKVTKEATCDEDGSRTRKCANDDSHTETEPISATGHEWGDWKVTKEATCTEDGSRTRKCVNDESHTETEPITATGVHTDVTDEGQAPTCSEDGRTAGKYCSVCGETLEGRETIPSTGHEWGEWEVTIDATCDTAGSKTRVCKNDGKHTETQPISKTGHDYGEWEVTIDATCDTAGSKTRVCKNDGKHTETQPISKTGHDFTGWTVTREATFDREGEERRVCKNDSSHVETRVIPKLTKPSDNSPTKPSVNPPVDSSENPEIPYENTGLRLLLALAVILLLLEAAVTVYSLVRRK